MVFSVGVLVAVAMEPIGSTVPQVINYIRTLEQNGAATNLGCTPQTAGNACASANVTQNQGYRLSGIRITATDKPHRTVFAHKSNYW